MYVQHIARLIHMYINSTLVAIYRAYVMDSVISDVRTNLYYVISSTNQKCFYYVTLVEVKEEKDEEEFAFLFNPFPKHIIG